LTSRDDVPSRTTERRDRVRRGRARHRPQPSGCWQPEDGRHRGRHGGEHLPEHRPKPAVDLWPAAEERGCDAEPEDGQGRDQEHKQRGPGPDDERAAMCDEEGLLSGRCVDHLELRRHDGTVSMGRPPVQWALRTRDGRVVPAGTGVTPALPSRPRLRWICKVSRGDVGIGVAHGG
jgi:hypothetical protein